MRSRFFRARFKKLNGDSLFLEVRHDSIESVPEGPGVLGQSEARSFAATQLVSIPSRWLSVPATDANICWAGLAMAP